MNAPCLSLIYAIDFSTDSNTCRQCNALNDES